MELLTQQGIIRMACAMFVATAESPCSPALRSWIVRRLHSVEPWTSDERARVKDTLLPWYQQHYPRTAAIVTAQFANDVERGVMHEKHHRD